MALDKPASTAYTSLEIRIHDHAGSSSYIAFRNNIYSYRLNTIDYYFRRYR